MALSASIKRATFGAESRLRRGKDFDRLFSEAQSLVGRTMVLRALPAAGFVSRCGVIASKRTFRRSVDRNRAKRLLREAFRLDRDKLPCACDLVLIARARILDAKIADVREDFCGLVQKVSKSLKRGAQA